MRKLKLAAILAAATLVTAALPAEAGKSKWDVLTYVGEDGPFSAQAANPKGKAIAAFDFLLTPDRALLLTDDKSYLPRHGNLQGKAVEAVIEIAAESGTVFNYYGEPDGCTAPANVRLYFETETAGLGESAFWWSNPESIALADLAALGATGTTLSVAFTSASWSDRDGHFGNFDAAHEAAFAASAGNVTTIGLSFGGGCFFAFGTGSDPAGATFALNKFSIR